MTTATRYVSPALRMAAMRQASLWLRLERDEDGERKPVAEFASLAVEPGDALDHDRSLLIGARYAAVRVDRLNRPAGSRRVVPDVVRAFGPAWCRTFSAEDRHVPRRVPLWFVPLAACDPVDLGRLPTFWGKIRPKAMRIDDFGRIVTPDLRLEWSRLKADPVGSVRVGTSLFNLVDLSVGSDSHALSYAVRRERSGCVLRFGDALWAAIRRDA